MLGQLLQPFLLLGKIGPQLPTTFDKFIAKLLGQEFFLLPEAGGAQRPVFVTRVHK
jgi:hypothetical protein